MGRLDALNNNKNGEVAFVHAGKNALVMAAEHLRTVGVGVVISDDFVGGEEGENAVDAPLADRVDAGVLIIAFCGEIRDSAHHPIDFVALRAEKDAKGFPRIDFNA